MKIHTPIFIRIVCVTLVGCAVANASSLEKGLVGVEVVKKEEISGSEPMCQLHFQFISGLEQTVRAKIASYQILDTKKLSFGMTGEKTIKPNSRSYISRIKAKSSCDDILNIAVDRTECKLINDQKAYLGNCDHKLQLIDNDLVSFIDKRN